MARRSSHVLQPVNPLMPVTVLPSLTTPGRRRARVLVATVAVAGLMFYAVFLAIVTPDALHSTDMDAIGYRFEPDDDEKVATGHTITAHAWPQGNARQVTATIHYRPAVSDQFRALPMQRIGPGPLFAAELPSLEEGQRAFYYLNLRDDLGRSVNIPESAPAGPLLHVRWEGHVNTAILAAHITLMIGALFFLVHAIHFSLLILGARAAGSSRGGLVAKVHRGVRWGWTCFFVGGIPLGIYVSGTALGWGNAWGGWPLGSDITDTKTEILIVYWAIVLALRLDLFAPGPAARLWSPISDRGTAILILAGAALTAIVYAIPHSYFLQ